MGIRQESRKLVKKLLSGESYKIVLLVVSFKLLTLVFIGWLSSFVNPYGRYMQTDILNLWNLWDAPHYVSIAEYGYLNTGDEANLIVFLPLYPILIKISSLLTTLPYLTSAYLISGIFAVLAGIFLYKLALLDLKKEDAVFAIFVMLVFPSALFFHLPYTESLFLFLAIFCFYLVRKKLFLYAFLIAALATFTRLTGLALIPALLFELLFHNREEVKRQPLLIVGAIMIPLLGFFNYLLINYLVHGDLFAYVAAQKRNWSVEFDILGSGLKYAFMGIFERSREELLWMSYAQIVAFFLGVLSTVYTFFKIRKSYALFMGGVLFMSYAMSFWMSMPRFLLGLFPLYMVLVIVLKDAMVRFVWLFISIALYITFCFMIIEYGYVF